MPIYDLIYDVGMNNGDDTAYYLSLGFRTIAIEANPELVEHAKSRFLGETASGRLIVLNIGIADHEGQLPFWICEADSRWSSFNREYASWHESPHHQIQVQASRFKTILAQYGIPYFCKIDIQGNESLCLEDLRQGDIPTFISTAAANLRRLEMLRALGYTLFKCISQSNFIPMQIPPVPEQRMVERAMSRLHSSKLQDRIFRRLGGRFWLKKQLNHTYRHDGWIFPPGSSGAFGNQTLGRWLSYDEMVETYNEFLRRRDAGQDSMFWSNNDLHAQYVDH